jgi:secondary thiamine-phosphate synthase enzyme
VSRLDRARAATHPSPVSVHRAAFVVDTRGRGTYDITREVAARLPAIDGVAHVFCPHTSASLILCENADPTVQQDLEAYFAQLVPDGDRPGVRYRHDAEGPDDMPAHLRAILTQSALMVPVVRGRLDLGTWQGIYLWEHRTAPHQRQIKLSVLG